MRLSELLQGVGLIASANAADIVLSGLCEHNLEVQPGNGFLAVADDAQAAARHAADAQQRGAVVVLSSHPLQDGLSVPCVQVANLADLRMPLARHFYGDPSAHMDCVGVTGTNGKTSVAFYVASLSELLGVRAGYSGTLGWGNVASLEAADMTTANAVALQRQLAALRASGCERVALEISSHALHQHRVDGVSLHTGVCTNLSRDHLDYHGSMQAYGAAKARLFYEWSLQVAVLNEDDAFCAGLLRDPLPDDEGSGANKATHVARIVRTGQSGDWRWQAQPGAIGLDVVWQTPAGEVSAAVPVLADFSVANITAAMAVLHGLGHSLEELAAALPELRQVPGRLELVQGRPEQPMVVVDYAHTPDALEKALAALKPVCRGRLVCVFGCGGDRDTGKRPQMGAVAERLAEYVVLTSDNPRSEDPQEIIGQIQAGMHGSHYEVCADRRLAICTAIKSAEADDIVLIAGKGHEDYQEIDGQRLPFDDRRLAREVLEKIAGGRV